MKQAALDETDELRQMQSTKKGLLVTNEGAKLEELEKGQAAEASVGVLPCVRCLCYLCCLFFGGVGWVRFLSIFVGEGNSHSHVCEERRGRERERRGEREKGHE